MELLAKVNDSYVRMYDVNSSKLENECVGSSLKIRCEDEIEIEI